MVDKIYVSGSLGEVNIRESNDGKFSRRVIAPLTRKGDPTDISEEHDDVKAVWEKAWTPEVVEAYRLHLESVV